MDIGKQAQQFAGGAKPQKAPPPKPGALSADQLEQNLKNTNWDAINRAAPTNVPDGYSQQTPGVGEQAQQGNEEFYRTPGQGEQVQGQQAGYFAQDQTDQERILQNMIPGMQQQGAGQDFVGGLLQNQAGMVGADNPAAQAYQAFLQNRPDIAQDPGLEPYYQNAQRNALEGINQNAAARGAYGSSAAMAQGQEAITNLRAEQANREADYGLRRLQEQRGWEGLGGQLAQGQNAAQLGWAQGLGGLGLGAEGMDTQRQMNAANVANMWQNQLQGRMGQGFNQAMGAQGMGMDRVGQGFNQAVVGQGLRDNRIQNMLQNQFQREQLYAPLIGGWQQGIMQNDQELMGGALGGAMAQGQEGANQQANRNEKAMQDAGGVLDIVKTLYGGGM